MAENRDHEADLMSGSVHTVAAVLPVTVPAVAAAAAHPPGALTTVSAAAEINPRPVPTIAAATEINPTAVPTVAAAVQLPPGALPDVAAPPPLPPGAVPVVAAAVPLPPGVKNYEVIPGQRKKSKLLLYADYIYSQDKISCGKHYYRCRKRTRCNATGYIENGEFKPTSGAHRYPKITLTEVSSYFT